MRHIRTLPRPILFISVLFLLAPILSYFLTASYNNYSCARFRLIFSSFSSIQLIIFGLCWVIAYGLLGIKKWAYYLLFVMAGILIFFNFWLLIQALTSSAGVVQMQRGQLSTGEVLFNSVIIILACVFIIYLLRREISAPYISVLPRGFREQFRDTIPMPYIWWASGGRIGEGITENISWTGCFVATDDFKQLVIGDQLELDIFLQGDFDGEKFSVRGEVVRARAKNEPGAPGVGIKFHFNKNEKKFQKRLKGYLLMRFSPRFKVENTISYQNVSGGERVSGKLFNVSEGGLYVECENLPERDERITVTINNSGINLKGQVCWLNERGAFDKEKGFGVIIDEIDNTLKFRFWLLRLRLLAPSVR